MASFEEAAKELVEFRNDLRVREEYLRVVRVKMMHAMKEAGLTQAYMAKLLGMQPSNLAREFDRYPEPIKPSDRLKEFQSRLRKEKEVLSNGN